MPLTADDLYQIRKIVVSAQLIAKGDWDAQIQAVDDAAQVLSTARDAATQKNEADSLARIAAAQAAADAASKQSSDDAVANKAILDQLTSKQSEVAAQVADAQTKLDALTQATNDYQALYTAKQADLDAREAALNKLDLNLAAKAQQLADAQTLLDAKIATVKSLAS